MARIELRLRKFDRALSHLDEVLRNDPGEVRAALLRGRVVEKQGNISEAALSYEQVASHGGEELAGEALFKLAKMRLRDKDYYEAAFDIRRISKERTKIKLYRALIEGVILPQRLWL